jgi:hypothetical protein
MSRTNNPKFNKRVKKEKPKSNDPRPKIKDFPNREAYRQAVLKWNKRRKDRIAKEKTEELKRKGLVKTSRGLKKRKTNNSLKVKPKGPYAKDRVGKVDLNSAEYKEAKRINEQTTSTPIKRLSKEERSKGDDLAGFRRTKDTRITKSLKKSGFTEDRLARLRKQHAEFKARRKKKKKK